MALCLDMISSHSKDMQHTRKACIHNRLQCDLNTSFRARRISTKIGKHVGNIVPRMSVKASTQALLIQVMRNETDASAENKETVEHTHLKIVLSLFGTERTAVAEQVNKADSHTSVNVQDEIVFLGSCDGLDCQGIVEQLSAGESLLDEFLDKLDTEIGVVS